MPETWELTKKCDYPFCRGPRDKDGEALILCEDKTGKKLYYHMSCYMRLSEIFYKIQRVRKAPCGQRLRWRKSYERAKYYLQRHIERHACEEPVSAEVKAAFQELLSKAKQALLNKQ